MIADVPRRARMDHAIKRAVILDRIHQSGVRLRIQRRIEPIAVAAFIDAGPDALYESLVRSQRRAQGDGRDAAEVRQGLRQRVGAELHDAGIRVSAGYDVEGPLFGPRRYPDIEGVQVLELVEPQPVEVVDFVGEVYAGQAWACAGHGGGEAGAER